MSDAHEAFSGYVWTYYQKSNGAFRARADALLMSVNWVALRRYASQCRCGMSCRILPDIGVGWNHLVRIIEFGDGVRWVARLQIPHATEIDRHDENGNPCINGDREYYTSLLIREKTDIPTPLIHARETSHSSTIGTRFMLLDCIQGNVAADLGKLPPSHRQTFMSGLARIHLQMSTVLLPKIGTVIGRHNDGTYKQGPIPGIGGPFDTATEFYEAWAANVEFGMPVEKLRLACGRFAEEVVPSVMGFPQLVSKIAANISDRNHGPFPLCHGDFGLNNTIVDDAYHILGLIDFETSFAGPWEIFADFPFPFRVVPSAIDAPWNYDENGEPIGADLKQSHADQQMYLEAVGQIGMDMPTPDSSLSAALSDTRKQGLARAMSLYEDGKAAWYSKIIEEVWL